MWAKRRMVIPANRNKTRKRNKTWRWRSWRSNWSSCRKSLKSRLTRVLRSFWSSKRLTSWNKSWNSRLSRRKSTSNKRRKDSLSWWTYRKITRVSTKRSIRSRISFRSSGSSTSKPPKSWRMLEKPTKSKNQTFSMLFESRKPKTTNWWKFWTLFFAQSISINCWGTAIGSKTPKNGSFRSFSFPKSLALSFPNLVNRAFLRWQTSSSKNNWLLCKRNQKIRNWATW